MVEIWPKISKLATAFLGDQLVARSFPPVTGGYSGQGQRGEYPPPMKQASVIGVSNLHAILPRDYVSYWWEWAR